MFSDIKPGHVLKFGTDPATIVSPKGAKNPTLNDNTLATPWPSTSDLGNVRLMSHPSGLTGDIAAVLANKLRPGIGLTRAISYSAAGRNMTAADRVLGSVSADFVGYVDGQSNFIASTKTVFSKDFSGCLMVAYLHNGQRHVAHAAAQSVPQMDCKQAFLDTLRAMNATLLGWCRPFVLSDSGRKAKAFEVAKQYMGSQINNLVTFGVITAANRGYAIDAFKPVGGGAGEWIVTYAAPAQMKTAWTVS